MGSGLRLRPASTGDQPTVLRLIEDAAGWLRGRGIRQWNDPYPSEAERDARVRAALAGGETWLLWDGPEPVATVSATPVPDEHLWTAWEHQEPAIYLHRLVVRRRCAGQGLGAALLDWIGATARREQGCQWIRIDVWADNWSLHEYYRDQGFVFLRQSTAIADYPAGALFQKDTGAILLDPERPPFAVESVPGRKRNGYRAKGTSRGARNGAVQRAEAS